VEQVRKGLQIRQAQHSAPSGQHYKGIRRGKTGPRGREGAQVSRHGILEEDARLTPGKPLRNHSKRLTGKGVERMRDGEDNVAIHAIGCS
jgi:hypothetical protein